LIGTSSSDADIFWDGFQVSQAFICRLPNEKQHKLSEDPWQKSQIPPVGHGTMMVNCLVVTGKSPFLIGKPSING